LADVSEEDDDSEEDVDESSEEDDESDEDVDESSESFRPLAKDLFLREAAFDRRFLLA
jgi:hypothetical protein